MTFYQPSSPALRLQPCDEPSPPSSSSVSSWTTQQVCQWLRSLHMDQYIPEFSAKDIDGEQLLQMDGNKLKVVMKMMMMMPDLTFYFNSGLSCHIERRPVSVVSAVFLSSAGSGRAQFVRPQRSEASHQRRPNGGREGEKSSGQTGETERKTEEERPGAAQELRPTSGGGQGRTLRTDVSGVSVSVPQISVRVRHHIWKQSLSS